MRTNRVEQKGQQKRWPKYNPDEEFGIHNIVRFTQNSRVRVSGHTADTNSVFSSVSSVDSCSSFLAGRLQEEKDVDWGSARGVMLTESWRDRIIFQAGAGKGFSSTDL